MIDTRGDLATWDQFKERSYAKYFSGNIRFNKQVEFLNLKHGATTVEEYEQEFDKFSHLLRRWWPLRQQGRRDSFKA